MAVPKTTRWAIEPHTRTKHRILQTYLHAWLPMMSTFSGRILFVDGFAGPGRYMGGEDGSPLIALKALLDHPFFTKPQAGREVVFFFIEQKTDRACALGEEIEDFKALRGIPEWVKIHVIEGEFAPVMTNLLDRIEQKGTHLAPTFAFIDPFGFAGVPMEVIARIAKNPSCECMITFMYESINRFLSVAEIEVHYDQLFGTTSWRKVRTEREPEKRRDGIVNLYGQQLNEVARFKHNRTFEMVNMGNRTEYFLFFATNNRHGISKMKVAMWKADPVQGEVFSDRTQTDQLVLIEPEPNLSHLIDLLRQRFLGRGAVAIRQVEDFVLFDTPYSEKIHLKQRTLKPMEQSEPPLISVVRPWGSPNRPGSYPLGTLITFL